MNSVTSVIEDEGPRVPTVKKLPASQTPAVGITLLAIDPEKEDCRSLPAALASLETLVLQASSFREAIALMHQSLPDLILCERDLPDGTWQEIVREAEGMRPRPAVVVVSRKPDERLWAEVLNLGAYDLLSKPYDMGEVRRTIRWACHCAETGGSKAAGAAA